MLTVCIKVRRGLCSGVMAVPDERNRTSEATKLGISVPRAQKSGAHVAGSSPGWEPQSLEFH